MKFLDIVRVLLCACIYECCAFLRLRDKLCPRDGRLQQTATHPSDSLFGDRWLHPAQEIRPDRDNAD